MAYEDRMMRREVPVATTRRRVVLRFRVALDLPVVRTTHDVPDDASQAECDQLREQVVRDLIKHNPDAHVVDCELVSRW